MFCNETFIPIYLFDLYFILYLIKSVKLVLIFQLSNNIYELFVYQPFGRYSQGRFI